MGILLWRKTFTIWTRGCYFWWETIPWGNLFFEKRFWVDISLGFESHVAGIALTVTSATSKGMGEITSAIGHHDSGGRATYSLNYSPTFALQLKKSTKNVIRFSRVVRLLFVPTWHKYLPSCRLKASPHQLTLSPNSQSVLWCGRRWMESPNLREFACY